MTTIQLDWLDCNDFKTCAKCGELKHIDNFYITRHVLKTGIKSYLQSWCKGCKLIQGRTANNPISVQSKICPECKVDKPSQEFSKRKLHPDGLARCCRMCAAIERKKYKENNPEIVRSHWLKSHQRNKSKRAAYRKIYYQRTREHQIEQSKIYRLKHKERYKEHKKRWNKENPDYEVRRSHKRRQRVRDGGRLYTKEEWQMILEVCDNRCLACGETEDITVDHIVPLVNGGTNMPQNLQPLCRTCNSRKQTNIIDYRSDELKKKIDDGLRKIV